MMMLDFFCDVISLHNDQKLYRFPKHFEVFITVQDIEKVLKKGNELVLSYLINSCQDTKILFVVHCFVNEVRYFHCCAGL